MYDWASPVGIGTYLKNEAAVDQSRDGFLEFFDAVLAKLPAAKITIIGHSMGNRFVDAALVRLHDKASALDSPVKLNEVIFAAADVDARAYANHCDKTATMAKVTRLYISDSDFALFSSDKAIHRYPRVGAPGALLKLLCKTPAQEVINATRLDIGHNMPFWLMADMHSLGKPAVVPAYNLKKVSENYFMLTGGPKP
jgi:esterase/lipase superfamily enzyme